MTYPLNISDAVILSNTLMIPDEGIEDFQELPSFIEAEAMIHRGRIWFSTENMRFLWDDKFQALLYKHNAHGQIVFGSLWEGDDLMTSMFYNYQMKDGVLRVFTGRLNWDDRPLLVKSRRPLSDIPLS